MLRLDGEPFGGKVSKNTKIHQEDVDHPYSQIGEPSLGRALSVSKFSIMEKLVYA